MSWLYDKFNKYRETIMYSAIPAVLAIATIGALSGKNEPTKLHAPLEERTAKECKKKPDAPAPSVNNDNSASNLAIIVGDMADTSDVVGMTEAIQQMQTKDIFITMPKLGERMRESMRAYLQTLDLIDELDHEYELGNYEPLIGKIYNARIKHEGKEYLVYGGKYGEKQKVWIVSEGTLENNRHVYMRQLPVGTEKLPPYPGK